MKMCFNEYALGDYETLWTIRQNHIKQTIHLSSARAFKIQIEISLGHCWATYVYVCA